MSIKKKWYKSKTINFNGLLLVLCVREQLKAEAAAANAARLARAVRVAARIRASSYPAVIARRTGLGDEEVWR